MPRVPLLGGAYNQASLIAGAQRAVNIFPEENPERAQAPVNVTHYVRPGRTRLGSPPQPGNGRGLFCSSLGGLYAVVDLSVYAIDANWQYTLLGQLLTPATTPVRMADNGTNLIIVDGTPNGSTVLLSTNTYSLIGDPNFLGSDLADFLDYFLILNQPGTPNWYSTQANSVTFNALNFGTKTAWPDNVIGVVAVERQAWVFGPRKAEIWTNAGTVPFAFQVLSGNIIEHGCAAKFSLAKMDVSVFWLSQSPEGARMAMKGVNNQAQRISTHAIEEEWLTYPRVDDAIGATYMLRGHQFYELHFPTADRTWVYDDVTRQWHEEAHIDNNGVRYRTRTPFLAHANGINVGLDYTNGSIYRIDETNFTDDGQPIVAIRALPHLLDDEFDRVTYWRLIADVETGNATGLPSVATVETPWSLGFSPGFGPKVLVEPPLISLRTSRDRGGSWGNPVMQPMGVPGRYAGRPTWNRLGYGTDMIFELSWSTPMHTALNGVFVIIEPHEADH